jgi:uncharacterized coiled-coil protein SlyX
MKPQNLDLILLLFACLTLPAIAQAVLPPPNGDKTNTPQFGLIAEEVAETNPELVVRDKKGNLYTVRHDAVNAMLLNEFLKEHRKKEQQEETIAQLKSRVAKQQAIAARQQEKIKDLARQLKSRGRKISE